MRFSVVAMLLGTCAIVATAIFAVGAPKPADLSLSWELEFTIPDAPRTIQVKVPGSKATQTFWYLRYHVANKTGQDQVFVPDFVLYTDGGQMLRAGSKVPPGVFDAIKKAYNDVFLEDMTGMAGKLLQGEDNAKDGVAIWPAFDPNCAAFDVFVSGLSGETTEVKLPAPIEVTEVDPITGKSSTVTKDKLLIAKTLDLKYALTARAAKLVSKDWVMR